MIRIVIPYRDRNHMLEAWADIPNVFIVEQAPRKPFNRGKLLNVGACLSNDDYYVFNDIDLVPLAPFIARNGVTQLAASTIQLHDYLGGSTMFDIDTFQLAGGYPNDFFCRAEDNSMRFHLKRLGIPVNVHLHPFKEQFHERPKIEFDPVLWERAKQPRKVHDQLYGNCKFTIIHEELTDFRRHVIVEI